MRGGGRSAAYFLVLSVVLVAEKVHEVRCLPGEVCVDVAAGVGGGKGDAIVEGCVRATAGVRLPLPLRNCSLLGVPGHWVHHKVESGSVALHRVTHHVDELHVRDVAPHPRSYRLRPKKVHEEGVAVVDRRHAARSGEEVHCFRLVGPRSASGVVQLAAGVVVCEAVPPLQGVQYPKHSGAARLADSVVENPRWAALRRNLRCRQLARPIHQHFGTDLPLKLLSG
mmetsp:Transcript_35506/g.92265  ORF Transcript_35506/g.92265 Transcript_35506/m.92265 type:complete len:225 (-) Transcript_35506:262-936(-)